MVRLIEDPWQIRKIVESPEPDVPRRAYAQWLRQHGNSFDSEFIDVQLSLTEKLRRHARVKEWAPLQDRSEEMLRIGRVGWTTSLHDLIEDEQISSPSSCADLSNKSPSTPAVLIRLPTSYFDAPRYFI